MQAVLKAMASAFVWSLPFLVVLVVGALFVQTHVFKDFEDPSLPFAIWPKRPPSMWGLALYLVLLLAGVVLPAWRAMRTAWTNLHPSDTSKTAATGHAATGAVYRRLALAVITPIALSVGLLVLIDGPGWRNWAWPVGGILKNAQKVTRLWDYYDRSKPWSVGGLRYLIPEDWEVEIVLGSGSTKNYQIIALAPPNITGAPRPDSLEPPPVGRIFIHNRLPDLIAIEQSGDGGDFRCKRKWRFGLTACWHVDRAGDQQIDTATYDYTANLLTSRNTRYDPASSRGLGEKETLTVYRESFYVLSEDPSTEFLARCRQGVCYWIFVDQGRSTVEVRFPDVNIKDWGRIQSTIVEALADFKERAQRYGS